ncbi:MAG: flagellar export protein FliJ [Deltaproteobacteria bacterium]|nr:MAG: flagellar export protein FliJ [Deltaproteobacteria bacterium]
MKFKLEQVLAYYQKQEERLSKELAEIKSKLQEHSLYLQSLKKERENLLNSIRGHQEHSDGLWDVIACFHYLGMLDKRIEKLKEEMETLKIQCEVKQKQLVEVNKEKKILERLKERWWQQEQKILLKKEQILLDEIAINGYVRREG